MMFIRGLSDPAAVLEKAKHREQISTERGYNFVLLFILTTFQETPYLLDRSEDDVHLS